MTKTAWWRLPYVLGSTAASAALIFSVAAATPAVAAESDGAVAEVATAVAVEESEVQEVASSEEAAVSKGSSESAGEEVQQASQQDESAAVVDEDQQAGSGSESAGGDVSTDGSATDEVEASGSDSTDATDQGSSDSQVGESNGGNGSLAAQETETETETGETETETKTWTVTFDSNGGSSVASQEVEDGESATEPENPTKESYVFDGWFTDSSLTTAYDFGAVTQDITLYAKWAACHTVSFDSEGGTDVPSQLVKVGEKAEKPSDPTKDGYKLVAWFVDSALTTEYDFDSPVNEDLTLFAKWVRHGLAVEDGKTYWYEDGTKVKLTRIDDGDLSYWFDEDCTRAANKAVYDVNADCWYWVDEDGTIAKNKDAFIPVSNTDRSSGKWVRCKADGTMQKGEDYAESKDDHQWHWWYFDLATGEMMKNFMLIVPTSGSAKWVFYDDTMGWMLYCEQYLRDKNDSSNGTYWYYLDDWTGAVTYRWKTISSLDKICYYDDVTGRMRYGWSYITDGVYGTNTQWHFFDRYTGALTTEVDRNNSAYNTWRDIQGGTSKTSYYIAVDKDNFRTIIFRWNSTLNNWDVVKDFKCGLGRLESNNGRGTQEGVWYLGENIPAGQTPTDEMWRANYPRILNDTSAGVTYRVHYIWDQGFHSTVYTSSTPAEQQLECYISDGCVRLLEENAKWLYENCANGTKVYIFKRY